MVLYVCIESCLEAASLVMDCISPPDLPRRTCLEETTGASLSCGAVTRGVKNLMAVQRREYSRTAAFTHQTIGPIDYAASEKKLGTIQYTSCTYPLSFSCDLVVVVIPTLFF